MNNKKIISAFEGLEEELKIITKIDNKKQNLKVDGYDAKNKINNKKSLNTGIIIIYSIFKRKQKNIVKWM